MKPLQSIFCLFALAMSLPAVAADLTEVVASQDLSVRRGEDTTVKERGIHPKNISSKEKKPLDRLSMIRFDSEDFGKGVRAVGLRLQPTNFSEYNKAMRFRVYGVNDGDEQDEKFEEKTYDPNAEGTIIDRRITTMIDRKQVTMLGTFATDKDEAVQFTSDLLTAFVRRDTNGTVTLVLVRETESWHNSVFAPRESLTPPTLVMKLEEGSSDEAAPVDGAAQPEADKPAEEAPAEEAPAEDTPADPPAAEDPSEPQPDVAVE